MKKTIWQKALSSSIFATALFCATAPMAQAITVDGTFDLNEWAGYYAADDGVGRGGFVDPGWGGQAYDVEYIGLKIVGNTVYFGLQTGYHPGTGTQVDSSGKLTAGAGDFSLDLNSDGTWDWAIDIAFAGSTPQFKLINMDNAAWRNVRYFPASNPYDAINNNNSTNPIFSGAFGSGSFSNNSDGGTSYVLEGAFSLGALGLSLGDFENMTLHWTMWCGNDSLSTDPTAPVPEPATMLLFGTGLAGLATVSRRKLRQS